MSNSTEQGLKYSRSLLQKKKKKRTSGGWNTLFPWLQRSHLKFSTVTLLSLLHVAVATLLSAIEHLDLGHVEQTHPHAFVEAGRQVLLAAAAEHRREGIPVSDGNIFLRERGEMEMENDQDPPRKEPIQSELISANCY